MLAMEREEVLVQDDPVETLVDLSEEDEGAG